MSAAVVSTSVPPAGGGAATAAAVAVAATSLPAMRPVLVCELAEEPRRRRATLLAAADARLLEEEIRGAGLGEPAARGHLCHLALPAELDSLDRLADAIQAASPGLTLVHLAPPLWLAALEHGRLRPEGGLLRADLPEGKPLAAIAVADLHRRRLRAKVVTRAPRPLAARRALAGIEPGGDATGRFRRLAGNLLAQRGQALPAVLGASLVLIFATLALTAIGGAITGKGRVQRAADLAALSGARSLRDDMPRLMAPRLLPSGAPNPRHLSRAAYLQRAESAARDAAGRNGVAAQRLEVSFPDSTSFPPLQVRARVRAELDLASLPRSEDGAPTSRGSIPVAASAVAEASPPAGAWTGMPGQASGGGYSGPLVYRQGEGMRPDVARAFDQMSAAASRAGHSLVVTSGFRSDAEQAELFARNPNPTWVAPPGRSLHRCATELDLGPSSAYGWLAANATRFGFTKRYSWEPWHFGFVAGPPACSAAANSAGADGAASGGGLPGFVPAQYRAPIERSAARWNVSAPLVAAQIMAESGFDPRAVSPAGAQGIAQFMPATARSYGLHDPFDPVAAIDAQAHMMSDLLRRFGSVPLALAAYNAGPGAVSGCGCVPPYPETRAYVARILALLDGSGAALAPPLEVRLVS